MFKNKKIVVLVCIMVISVLSIIIYFLCPTRSNFENKLFISENSDLFFLEPWEPLDVTKYDEWKTTTILYISKGYVYMFSAINSASATGLITEYKGKYTFDKDKLTFSFDKIGEYSASLTKDGILSLELITANSSHLEQFVGSTDRYSILKNYEYDTLKELYTINLEKSLKNGADKLCKEIGEIIGTSLYTKSFNNNDFGFQYNPDNLDHPFSIVEKSKKINNLVLSSIKKVSNTTWSISLSENKNDTDKVFALVLETSKKEITAEFERVKIKTNNPVDNHFSIYEKSLILTYPLNNAKVPTNSNEENTDNNQPSSTNKQNSNQNNNQGNQHHNNNQNNISNSNNNNVSNNQSSNNTVNEETKLEIALKEASVTLTPYNDDYFYATINGDRYDYSYEIKYNDKYYSDMFQVAYKDFGKTCYDFEITIDRKVSKNINKCITLEREKLNYQVDPTHIATTAQCRVRIHSNNSKSYNSINKVQCTIDNVAYGVCENINGFFVEEGSHSIIISNNYEKQHIDFNCNLD